MAALWLREVKKTRLPEKTSQLTLYSLIEQEAFQPSDRS